MQKLGALNALYPTPTTLVGATVNGKPNVITIAHVGIMTITSISLGINKAHYSNAGIRANKTFSVCLPSQDMMVATDYCGLVSGKNEDKAPLFDIFYGDLKTAPMIRECPVCMECSLEKIVDFPSHDVFVGEVKQTYAHDTVIVDGKVDISRVKPLLFDMSSIKYWSLGNELGKCWSVGKQLKKGRRQ